MLKLKPKIYFVANVEFAVNAFLLNHLQKLSHYYDLTVIVNTKDTFFLVKQGLDVKVIDLKISRNISLASDFYCLIYLLYLFTKNRPAAVHSITPKSGLLAMIASYFSGVPLRIHTFTGQVWVNKVGFSKALLKSLDALIGLLASFIIVDSCSQQEFLIQQKIVSKKKSVVFGSGSVSGVNLKKFVASKKEFIATRRELSIPIDAFVFIYLGRLHEEKGVLDLAAAFQKIQDDSAYLIFVGPDDCGLAEQIKLLDKSDINRIRFIGLTSMPERYLAASNTLCLPSYREGFGNVIIEAAAIGVPAIASNIYGISDAIVNQKTGFLNAPKDVNAITDAMQYFLENPKVVKKYGCAAKKRVRAEFDANRMSESWLNFYQTKFIELAKM